jgi:predicted methyltransferase
MTDPVVLSHFQTSTLLQAQAAGKSRVHVSPDLGISIIEVIIEPEGVRFAGGEVLGWTDVKEIDNSKNSCFVVMGRIPRKIQRFSQLTNRAYTLMPTAKAPTMLVSGIPMHRIKGIDPVRDTREKMKTIAPLVGPVLDTATGLGYTAIEAAKTADSVMTVELDPLVLEIARLNPWSRALFDNPRITQHIGDSFEVVAALEDHSFARVIHDPPTLSLAGDLYSLDFYIELHRVLQSGGRVFHYVGDPKSASGRNVTRGVKRRLQQAGFNRVLSRPRAFGVVASKGGSA